MIRRAGVLTTLALASLGCGQDTIQLPEVELGGACQPGYPQPVGETGAVGLAPGNTFPCMVFESVRQGSYDDPNATHLNLDDVHISYRLEEFFRIRKRFGISEEVEPKYIVFVSAAVNCPECASYTHDLAENVASLESAGILPVAVANNDLLKTEKGLELQVSEALLEEDLWPSAWLRTNDEVDNLTTQMALWPTTIALRLQDMKVLINNTGIGNAADLLEEVALQNAAWPIDATQAPDQLPSTPDTPDPDTPIAPDGPLCDACPGPICVRQVTGRLLFPDDTPCADCGVQVCTPACRPLVTDASGEFVYDLGEQCMAFDFDKVAPIHFQLTAHRETHATYSAEYAPTQAELGDKMVLSTGDHYLFPFDDGGVTYDGTQSVVLDKDGVRLSVAPGELEVDGPVTLNVLRFPLETWVPPFVEDPRKIDALFVLSPYFEEFKDPATTTDFWSVDVSVQDSALGWDEQTDGRMWVLGDYVRGFMQCSDGGDDLHQGALEECLPMSRDSGQVNSSIPRMVWMAFGRE